MNQKGFANIILIVLVVILAGALGYITLVKKQGPAIQQTTPPSATTTTATSETFPPNGWYVHNYLDIPALGTAIMLTKEKTYPVGYCESTEWACYGEQIGISVSTTTLTPEQYIANITVYPSIQKWGTLNGHKIFSITYTTDANPTPTDEQYLFVGNKVYQFSLYPSAEKDRNDFQQVVNYYAKNIAISSQPILTQTQAQSLVLQTWGGCTPDTCGSITVSVQNNNGQYTVTAIYEGLRDDSTSAQKKVAPAYYSNNVWTLGNATVTQQCQPGRGHQDFSSALCI